MTDGSFEDHTERHDLVVDGAASRRLSFTAVSGAMDAVLLDLARRDLGHAELAEEAE